MSQENVEIIRRGYEAFKGGDLDSWLELFDPDVEIVTLLLGNHHGKEAVRRLLEESRKNLPGWALDPVELIDAGPDMVIAVLHMGGTGPVSHIDLGELGERIAFGYTMRDGLVVRLEVFTSKDEALEAAGLSE